MVRAGWAVAVGALLAGAAAGAAWAGDEERGAADRLRVLWTERIGQLTGTSRNPIAALGLRGTDLGVSFVRDGRVVFLFGDSWTLDRQDWDADSAAWAPLAPPADGSVPRLTWFARPGGRFLPLRVPSIDLGGMNVPVEGVPVGDRTYVFFSSGWSKPAGRHSHSVLAHCPGLEFERLDLDHSVPTEKFVNVSVVVDRDTAWIFGTGAFRKSAVYLARVPVAQLADRGAWRYAPDYGADERTARPLFEETQAGEISVRRDAARGLWWMATCKSTPRGVHLRTAARPEGPWSAPLLLFDPTRPEDRGYGHFLHAAESQARHDDGLSEPGREEEPGGEYGAYLVPEWFTSPQQGLLGIVYTLSSWNPYQVHVLRTWVAEPGVELPRRAAGAGLPRARIRNGDFRTRDTKGWNATGDEFEVFKGEDGRWRVTTFGRKRDATVGQLWQEFAVDAASSELSFLVHGGTCGVSLVCDGEVVRTSRGRRSNEQDVPVVWRLEEFRGRTVKLAIDDDQTGPWGFVGATAFEIR